jgi:hypothetical protein
MKTHKSDDVRTIILTSENSPVKTPSTDKDLIEYYSSIDNISGLHINIDRPNKNNENNKPQKRPTQKEFWDAQRANGLTQSQIAEQSLQLANTLTTKSRMKRPTE